MARLLSEILVSHQSQGGAFGLVPGLLLVVVGLSALVLVLGMCTLKHRSGESKRAASTSPMVSTSSESDASWDRSGPLLEGCMTPLTPKATLKKLQWLTKSKESKRQELLHDLEEEYRKQDALLFDNDSGSAVWQRTILMGEKCEPPAFSGLILYDERGNRVPEFPAKSPKAGSAPTRVLS